MLLRKTSFTDYSLRFYVFRGQYFEYYLHGISALKIVLCSMSRAFGAFLRVLECKRRNTRMIVFGVFHCLAALRFMLTQCSIDGILFRLRLFENLKTGPKSQTLRVEPVGPATKVVRTVRHVYYSFFFDFDEKRP